MKKLIGKIVFSVILYSVIMFVIVVATSILNDYKYKGETTLTQSEFTQLINDDDWIEKYLSITEMTNESVTIEYDFEADVKIEQLDRLKNETTEWRVILVLSAAGLFIVPMIVYALVWRRINE